MSLQNLPIYIYKSHLLRKGGSLLFEIKKIFEDRHIDEIFLQGGARGFKLSKGEFTGLDIAFKEGADFLDDLHMFATDQNKRLDALNPSCGGSLGGGDFRWHAIIPPMSPLPSLAVRRHRFDQLEISDFGLRGEVLRDLQDAMSRDLPILVAGATGSGKTSLLMAMLRSHSLKERVVVLEQFDELPMLTPLWQKLLTVPSNRQGVGALGCAQIFSEALRIRPDRIVIGEIRREEAEVFLESLTAGHRGTWATIHAGDIEEVVTRLAYLTNRQASNKKIHIVMLGKKDLSGKSL
jgi:pilus assembly protein CpaF